MADIADIAGQSIEACTEDAERRARGKSAPEQHPDFDGRHCVEPDCGVEIQPERLNTGRVRCIDCQILREKRDKMAAYNGRST